MSGRLIIVLPAQEGAPFACGFSHGAAAGGEHRQCPDPGQIPAEWLAEAEEICVIVPGTDCLVRAVALPAKTEAQARAALPYLLEEALARDTEDIHFALGAALADRRRLVGAVDRRRLTGWTDRLADAGIQPTHLIPDFMALPAEANAATVLERDDRVLVRLGAEGGFAIEKDLIGAVLPELLTASHIEKLVLHGKDAEALLAGEDHGGREIVVNPQPDTAGVLALYDQGVAAGPPINFLQGDFTPPRQWDVDRRLVRMAAATIGLLGIAYLALTISQGLRYDRLADQAAARSEAVFRQAFPDVERVVNPRAQMRSRLAALGGGGADSFLRLSGLLFTSIGQFESVAVESLRFNQGENELAADLVYPNFADMERIRQAVSAQGGILEEGTSRQRGGQVVGDVTIRLAQ